MLIAGALREQEQNVDELIKTAAKYLSSLKSWKKACQSGHVGNRQKAASAALELSETIHQSVSEAADGWTFDVRAYLESNEWRAELQAACAAINLRVMEEDEVIISPPVVVRSQAGHSRLVLGNTNWPNLNPATTAEQLRKLNEKSVTSLVLQRFLNALYDGAKKVGRQDGLATFRDIYNLFAYAPDWKRENPEASFALQIYALHKSDVRSTRDGKVFELEFPSGKLSKRDVFTVISDDGRPIRYYGIWFK